MHIYSIHFKRVSIVFSYYGINNGPDSQTIIHDITYAGNTPYIVSDIH